MEEERQGKGKNMKPINLESVLMRHVFPNMQHLFSLTKAGLSPPYPI